MADIKRIFTPDELRRCFATTVHQRRLTASAADPTTMVFALDAVRVNCSAASASQLESGDDQQANWIKQARTSAEDA